MSELQIGYAAMLEQFAPAEAVALSAYAEEHGFSGVMAADHFQPWVPAQGESSFVWSVLAAIGERTKGDMGPGVTAPTFRWHPAMVAQASATLASMYPGRHWLGLGSGEALNSYEMISMASNMRLIRSGAAGQYWPTMCSLSAAPEPRPSQCRPGYIEARVAEAWATMAGCHRNVGAVTPGPRSPFVRSPIAASTLQTKDDSPWAGTHGWKWSAAITPEKPCSSA